MYIKSKDYYIIDKYLKNKRSFFLTGVCASSSRRPKIVMFSEFFRNRLEGFVSGDLSSGIVQNNVVGVFCPYVGIESTINKVPYHGSNNLRFGGTW